MRHITTLTVALAFLMCGCFQNENTLHVYTWSDYIDPEAIARFECENDCKVVIDTFDSNESMYAKLKAGCAGYDIIMPSSYQVAQLVKEQIIDEIDKTRLTNVVSNFDHAFDTQVLDRELKYSVPYAVTYTGLMYLKSKIPDGTDMNSWKAIENQAFIGKVTLLDDIRDVIGTGLMALGYSLNSTNETEISEAAEYIISKIRPNVRKFDAESYKLEVPSGSVWIGHGYSSDAIQVILGDGESRRDDIGFALPREGFTIAWDELCIMRSSMKKDLAYKFIDFMFDADVACANIQYICAPMANKPALDKIDTELRKTILPPEDLMGRGQVLTGFSDRPEVMEMYNKAWDKIKSIEK